MGAGVVRISVGIGQQQMFMFKGRKGGYVSSTLGLPPAFSGAGFWWWKPLHFFALALDGDTSPFL